MDHAAIDNRALWRCRRGTKELDVILSGFMDAGYHHLSVAEKSLFRELLELEDTRLTEWLCHGVPPNDQGMVQLVRKILSAGHR